MKRKKRYRYQKRKVENIFYNNTFYLILLAIFLFVSFKAIYPIVSKKIELHKSMKTINQKIKQAILKKERLEEENHLLKTDYQYIESLARERLGFVRQDEIVYQILDASTKK